MDAGDFGDAAARERKARRGSIPIRVFPLGQEPNDDLSASTTPEQRLAMMWPLALQAWALAGRPLPEYSREEAPVRILRPPAENPPSDSR